MKTRLREYLIMSITALCLLIFNINAQAQTFKDDVATITHILANQGNIHQTLGNNVMSFNNFLAYSVVGIDGCMLTTSQHWDSKFHGPDGHGSTVFTYNYSYNLKTVSSIEIIANPDNGNKDSNGFTYDNPIFQVTINLNTLILPQKILFQSTTPNSDIPIKPTAKTGYVLNNMDDAQKIVDALNRLSKSCEAVTPFAKQNADDLPAEEQAHYKQVLNHGKPALMYATALDMSDEGHSSLALQMLQALIEKYPDDAYAAKAIDKRETLRNQGKKSSSLSTQQFSSPSAKTVQADDNKLQRMQACQSSCQTTKNSCDMTYSNNMGTQLGNTINGLRGHNSAAAQQAGAQILGDPNACQNEFDSCNARCGG